MWTLVYLNWWAGVYLKYGKDWRDKVAIQEYISDPVSNWEKSWQEKNLDGSFAYNNVTDDF